MSSPITPASRTFRSPDAAATRRIGAAIAGIVRPGAVVALHGPLGAGKTTLTQGIALGLGVAEAVVSPTFVLVREYAIPADRDPWAGAPPARLVHLDFYRLSGSPEALDLGLTDYLAGGDLVVVEWPERAPEALPPHDVLHVTLDLAAGGDGEARRITVAGRGDWVAALAAASEGDWVAPTGPAPEVDRCHADPRPASEAHR